MNRMRPLISVIVVNFNGRQWLKRCLSDLLKQNYAKVEIILVDNGSTDGSSELVKRYFPKVKLINSGRNLGFAGGNNLGIKAAKGEYLVLVNNDVTVGKNYLADLLLAFDQIPNLGMVQSKIRLMSHPKLLDTCGAYWTNSTLLYHFGNGKLQDLKKYNQPRPVFSVKGASVMVKRSVLDLVGVFDDDFWCYYEETDLCQRIWSAGFECWYWPKAELMHAAGGTSLSFPNPFIQFHNFKNKLLSMIKNFEDWRLIYILPIFLMIVFGLSWIWLIKGRFGHWWSLYRAVWWNIWQLPKTLVKRARIQALRKVSDASYLSRVQRQPKLSYYKYLLADNIAGYKDEVSDLSTN